MTPSMPKDQEFMLPVSGPFIALSLLVALLLNWLPLHGIWLALRPDFVALVLLYWCTHKPYRINIGIAWAIGIFADVSDATLFGQHALAYTVLAFGGVMLHRRVQMFDLREQSMQVFPLLLLSYAVYVGVHWQLQNYVAWEYFLGSATSALLWAPMTVLLQTLRRPRSNPDEL